MKSFVFVLLVLKGVHGGVTRWSPDPTVSPAPSLSMSPTLAPVTPSPTETPTTTPTSAPSVPLPTLAPTTSVPTTSVPSTLMPSTLSPAAGQIVGTGDDESRGTTSSSPVVSPTTLSVGSPTTPSVGSPMGADPPVTGTSAAGWLMSPVVTTALVGMVVFAVGR